MSRPQAAQSTFIAHRRERDGVIQSVADHLLQVGSLSGIFAAKIGLPFSGELIGIVHDLGKYSTEFQAYIKSATGLLNPDQDEDAVDFLEKKGKVDHSTAGAQFIWNHLTGCNIAKIWAQILAICVASHHSGLIDCIGEDFGSGNVIDLFRRRISKAEEKAHCLEVEGKADDIVLQRIKQLLNEGLLSREAEPTFKKLVLTDRQQSGRGNQGTLDFKIGLLVRYLFSCLIDADRVDSADFESPKEASYRQRGSYLPWNVLSERLEKHLLTFSNRSSIAQIRNQISLACYNRSQEDRGIYTLTVPTGGGKTLASLRFALNHARIHNLDRIVFVAPFTSIIDQNAKVVRGVLECQIKGDDFASVVLEIHSNLTEEASTWKSKILSESWDAPVVFTTCVQFLETLFSGGTRAVRRMHQLANAVVVIDEAQAMPVKCIHLLNNALNFLVGICGSTVVLSTASQPLLHRVDRSKGALQLDPQKSELMPDVDRLFEQLKRVNIIDRRKAEGWSLDELADIGSESSKADQSCLYILNTKKTARVLLDKLMQRGSTNVFHLSTAMCPAHRMAVLETVKELLAKKQGVLCVSTQLIEAGVDVDFSRVVRAMAGLDSIAQAAGRCNRNGTAAVPGEVLIVNVKEENLNKLPDIVLAQEHGERVLREWKDLGTPADLLDPYWMRQYFQYHFFARKHEMSYAVSKRENGRDDDLLNLLSTNSNDCAQIIGQVESQFMHAFKRAGRSFKAIDSATRGVLVPYDKRGTDLINALHAAYWPNHLKFLNQAQHYSVNLWPHEIEHLKKMEALILVGGASDLDIYTLKPEYYSPSTGVTMEVTQPMEFLYA